MKMNKYLLSLPLPFLRRQEAMLYAFTGAMRCPGHRSTLVPAQQLPVGPFGVGGHTVCLLVYTWCHAAWGQGRCMRSCRPAFLLEVWSRAAASPGSLTEMPNLWPHPDLLSWSMQYNKTPSPHHGRDSCAMP